MDRLNAVTPSPRHPVTHSPTHTISLSRTRVRALLWGIIALAVLLRLASALYQGDTVAALPGIHDQFSYDALARRVLAGYGFSFATDWWPLTRAGEPTAHWSYLYTLYLAAVYALFGPHPLAARLIQAVVAGVLHPWLAYRIGRRLLSSGEALTLAQREKEREGGGEGELVGLVAAALTATYAYFIYYAGALMTETFYILAVLWALDLAFRTCPERSRRGNRRIADVGLGEGENPQSEIGGWVLLGLALGIAALLRQVILFFVPFLFAWLWWAARRQGEGENLTPSPARPLSRFFVSLAVIAALILPCTLRNYRAFGRFVLLNTNAGYAFFWANHPIYGTHFVGILPPDGPSYQDLIPTELRGLDEAALDQALLREGLHFVIEDPARYILLSISRVREYFKFWPSSESSLISNISRSVSFGLALPFIIYGLWLSVSDRSRLHHVRSVTLLYLFVVIYSLIHLLSWSLIRYRLPVDAVLVLFAGVAVVDLAARMTRSKRALIQVQR